MKCLILTALIFAAAIVAGRIAPADAGSYSEWNRVGFPPLSRAQTAQVRKDTLYFRICPAEMDPYAINEKGGDCIGGESGSPSQNGSGGGS